MLRQDLTSSAIGPPATHGGSDVHHCLNVSKPLKPFPISCMETSSGRESKHLSSHPKGGDFFNRNLYPYESVRCRLKGKIKKRNYFHAKQTELQKSITNCHMHILVGTLLDSIKGVLFHMMSLSFRVSSCKVVHFN